MSSYTKDLLIEEFDDDEDISFILNEKKIVEITDDDVIIIDNHNIIEEMRDIEQYNDADMDDSIPFINIIPQVIIEVDCDENDEKLVRLTLELPLYENSDETITIDLNITKKIYLMIAEELFN